MSEIFICLCTKQKTRNKTTAREEFEEKKKKEEEKSNPTQKEKIMTTFCHYHEPIS